MKITRFTAVFLTLVIISGLCVCLSSCQKDGEEVVNSVEVREGSLKNSYNLDEKLNLANVFIVVNGTKVVGVTADMVEGFNTDTVTPTASPRQMRIVYLGKYYTSYWSYHVVSTYQVNTKARINAVLSSSGDNLRLILNLSLDELKDIYAVSFTVEYNSASYTPSAGSFIGNIKDWEISCEDDSAGKLGVVYYAPPSVQPLNSGGKLLTLDFTKLTGTVKSVTVSGIILSDRKQEFYLPDSKPSAS